MIKIFKDLQNSQIFKRKKFEHIKNQKYQRYLKLLSIGYMQKYK